LNCLDAMTPTGTLLKDGQVYDGRIECLREINQIHGLGSISFSSKVARFLAPAEYGVLDSLVANVLGVDVTRNNKATRTNLADYSLRLKEIANELNERKDFLATCELKSWIAADVDLALWAFAKYGLRERAVDGKSSATTPLSEESGVDQVGPLGDGAIALEGKTPRALLEKRSLKSNLDMIQSRAEYGPNSRPVNRRIENLNLHDSYVAVLFLNLKTEKSRRLGSKAKW